MGQVPDLHAPDGLSREQLIAAIKVLSRPSTAASYEAANTEQYRRRLRWEVIQAYGARCTCCGEKQFEFLTVDHEGGWGGAHRKKFGSTYLAWADLRRRGWPKEGIRILCANCHHAVSFCGGCPHKEADNKASP